MRTAASKSLFATDFAAADMEHEWLRGPRQPTLFRALLWVHLA